MMHSVGEKEDGEGGGGEEEKKRQKRGGKGIMKARKKEDGPKQVCISRAPRGKKKSVTVVTGLSTFGECYNRIVSLSICLSAVSFVVVLSATTSSATCNFHRFRYSALRIRGNVTVPQVGLLRMWPYTVSFLLAL